MTRTSGGGRDGRYGDGPGTVDPCDRAGGHLRERPDGHPDHCAGEPVDGYPDGSPAGDLEEFLAVQEDLARRTLVAADFPVYGIAPVPGLGGGALVAYGTADGGAPDGGAPDGGLPGTGQPGTGLPGAGSSAAPGWIELGFGDWTSPDGPYVTVRTHRPGADRYEPLPELEDVVEDERDRVYEQLGVDEGDTPARVRALREWITVDGESRAVEVHEDRRGLWSGAALPGCCPIGGAEPVWAGRFRVDGLTVTVCGRGVPPGGVELARIRDHERCLSGRTALLRELALRRGRDLPVEQRELSPAAGLEAHRAVIAHGIVEAAALEARLRSGRPPRPPRGARAEAGALRWEAAVRQQMRLASETRAEAAEAVAAMVEQLGRLSQLTHWVVGTPEGDAAMEESIRYTVFASEVASVPAQRAWRQVRRGERGEHRMGEQLWLAAWEQWRAARAGS
ncbi:hypothetical protein ABTX81_31315 [Kitasatospora sp. NPDC097605]|uniref:hypothetical protein n=1 Tax=Kitasatospora sp. NPDC097605 TaxID=3157226 RepID=UPI0033220CCC